MSLRMEIIKLECLQFDAIFFFFYIIYLTLIGQLIPSKKKKLIKFNKKLTFI